MSGGGDIEQEQNRTGKAAREHCPEVTGNFGGSLNIGPWRFIIQSEFGRVSTNPRKDARCRSALGIRIGPAACRVADFYRRADPV